MKPIDVFTEFGKKKVFAGAVDWPGWCRSGRDESAALQALIEYGPRYSQALVHSGIDFHSPTELSDLMVVERVEGNVTTDFGAPAVDIDADGKPINAAALAHSKRILQACWMAFDAALEQAKGRELQKGPRGGGRDLEKILNHVLDADRGYLSRLNYKFERAGEIGLVEAFNQTRQAIIEALDIAVAAGLPERGPRGGIIWRPRFFVRRVAWHVLDHAWEIEDRIEWMKIVEATAAHLNAWINLRQMLWDDTPEEHYQEMERILSSDLETAFLLFDEASNPIGFIEGAIYLTEARNYGYVEGWFVHPDFRGQGLGGQLLDALEQWILHHAISLVLSDTIPAEYPLSPAAHSRHGFKELMTLQLYIKSLDTYSSE